jgi:hypothetical protein
LISGEAGNYRSLSLPQFVNVEEIHLFCYRDEGGLDYKASIADTIIAVIEENPEAKENGLSHLCEFIEDCEHTSLAVKILHLLGMAFFLQRNMLSTSVSDPECLSRVPDFYPSWISDPGSRIQQQ